MNTMRICKYLLTKRLLSELVLIFQLVGMVIFGFVVLNPIDTYLQQERALRNAYRLEPSEVFHFCSSNALFENRLQGGDSASALLYERLSGVSGVKEILRAYTGIISYDTGNAGSVPHAANISTQVSANFIAYSKEFYQYINLGLSQGSLAGVEHSAEQLPIVVSPSLAGQLPLGTVKEFTIYDIWTGEELSIPCVVVGTLQEDCAFPVINNGSWVLANRPVDFPNHDFILACCEQDSPWGFSWTEDVLICPAAGSDLAELKEALTSAVGSLGTIYSMEENIRGTYSEMLRQNRSYLFAFALLSLIAVFGYGGYLFLMIRQRQREFSVFYILGMTRRAMAGYIFSMGACLLLVAFVLAHFITPWFIDTVLHREAATPGLFSYLFCGGLLLLVLLVSVLTGFRQSSRLAEIAVYREGE